MSEKTKEDACSDKEAKARFKAALKGVLAIGIWLVARLRLPRVGDDLLELRHCQWPGHAEFADDE
jgi:hypothetical protein